MALVLPSVDTASRFFDVWRRGHTAAPRHPFLFYVHFEMYDGTGADRRYGKRAFGLHVRDVGRPSASIDVEVRHQYNRKRAVPRGHSLDELQITAYDVADGAFLRFAYELLQYHVGDYSRGPLAWTATLDPITPHPDRTLFWGVRPREAGRPPSLLRTIRVYELGNGFYNRWTWWFPVPQKVDFGRMDTEEGDGKVLITLTFVAEGVTLDLLNEPVPASGDFVEPGVDVMLHDHAIAECVGGRRSSSAVNPLLLQTATGATAPASFTPGLVLTSAGFVPNGFPDVLAGAAPATFTGGAADPGTLAGNAAGDVLGDATTAVPAPGAATALSASGLVQVAAARPGRPAGRVPGTVTTTGGASPTPLFDAATAGTRFGRDTGRVATGFPPVLVGERPTDVRSVLGGGTPGAGAREGLDLLVEVLRATGNERAAQAVERLVTSVGTVRRASASGGPVVAEGPRPASSGVPGIPGPSGAPRIGTRTTGPGGGTRSVGPDAGADVPRPAADTIGRLATLVGPLARTVRALDDGDWDRAFEAMADAVERIGVPVGPGSPQAASGRSFLTADGSAGTSAAAGGPSSRDPYEVVASGVDTANAGAVARRPDSVARALRSGTSPPDAAASPTATLAGVADVMRRAARVMRTFRATEDPVARVQAVASAVSEVLPPSVRQAIQPVVDVVRSGRTEAEIAAAALGRLLPPEARGLLAGVRDFLPPEVQRWLPPGPPAPMGTLPSPFVDVLRIANAAAEMAEAAGERDVARQIRRVSALAGTFGSIFRRRPVIRWQTPGYGAGPRIPPPPSPRPPGIRWDAYGPQAPPPVPEPRPGDRGPVAPPPPPAPRPSPPSPPPFHPPPPRPRPAAPSATFGPPHRDPLEDYRWLV